MRELSTGADSGRPSAPNGAALRWKTLNGWELAILVVIAAGFVAGGLLLISLGPPLGHDESVYALRSRFYVHGDVHGGYWNDYRAVGLPLFMAPMWLLSGTEPYLRVVVLAFGALGVVLTWVWTRLMFGRASALVAAGLLALMPMYLNGSWQITPDVPGMAISLAALLLFAWASRGRQLSLVALGVVPLVGIATMVRYGAPVILVPGLVSVGLAHWKAVRARFVLTSLVALGSIASVIAVLFVPAVTGGEQAPVMAIRARRAAKAAYSRWDSVSEFIEVAPSAAGVVGGLLLVGGVLLCVLWARSDRVLVRRVTLNLAIAIGFFILLNISLDIGRARYLVPALPFLVACSAAGIVAVGRRLPLAVCSLFAGAVVFGSVLGLYDTGSDKVTSLERFGPVREASQRLGARFGPDCVILTGYSPQVSWYSGCAARALPYSASGKDEEELWSELSYRLTHNMRAAASPDASVIALFVKGGKRQPEGNALETFRTLFDGVVFETGNPDGRSLQHVRAVSIGKLGPLQDAVAEREKEKASAAVDQATRRCVRAAAYSCGPSALKHQMCVGDSEEIAADVGSNVEEVLPSNGDVVIEGSDVLTTVALDDETG